MLEPLSMTAAMYLGSKLAFYAQPTSAVSQEAQIIRVAAHKILSSTAEPQSLFRSRDDTFSELAEAIDDLIVDADQAAVDRLTFEHAKQFLFALPDDLSSPDVGVDPDGAISLAWFASRTRIFSVSIDDSDRVAFAWLDGSDKGHGVERFRPPMLPQRIAMMLRSIVTDGTPSLRVA